MDEKSRIKPGDFVIIQRKDYTKLYKIGVGGGTAKLGKDKIQLANAVGQPYFSTFRMVYTSKANAALERVDDLSETKQVNPVGESGTDNRNIVDDGSSQALTKDEIESMPKDCVIGQLIENSKTFASKTEYSQAKYLKKKEKKHCEYIQIRRPSIRLLSEIYYRYEPAKTLGIRIDDLSQIITYANIQSGGNYLLYDSGTCGLVPATILNAMGPNTTGKLVYGHPGNECQKEALLAMHFPDKQYERYVHVNIYSVLRCYYQEKESYDINYVCEDDSNKRKRDDNHIENSKKKSWQVSNEEACRILEGGMDALIVVTKQHPSGIVKGLTRFLKTGRPLVLFSLVKEPLHELYFYLKTLGFINLQLSSTFMRNYQVLPERTHPHVNMSFGGYILTGVKIE